VTRVLLVATTTGYQIRSFGEAAEALGIRLSIASDRCDRLEDPWWDHAIPVRFHDEGAAVDAVVRALGNAAPDAVLAVGDRPTVLAARLNAAFGLPGNPPDAAAACRNKLQSKARLERAGLLTAEFRPLASDVDPTRVAGELVFPTVIKPLALSGSRGVIRVNDRGEFVAGYARLRQLLGMPDVRSERDPAHDTILVERFIPGAEYAVEGVLTRGRLQVFAIFDKPDPLDGPFFEETIYVTPSRAAGQAQLVETVAAAARALGLWHGPVHAECRVNGRGVYVLEVAARPIGGLCSRALRFVPAGEPEGKPLSLEDVLLRHALGEDVSGYTREPCASGVMMLPIPRRGVLRRVGGVEEAVATPGIEDVRITAKVDSLIVPLPEGRSYLGFAFARGGDPQGVEQALRQAHARLQVIIDKDVPLVDDGRSPA
jgi:hypothetical protein